MNSKTSYSKFQIIRTIDTDGVPYWTVQRRDGQSFGNGWLGLNFLITDYESAINCCRKLEAESK